MLRACWSLLLAIPAATALPRTAHRRAEEGASSFAIMMDAGSSGTRAHVYSWPSDADCPSRLSSQLVVEIGEGEQITPGISFFAPTNCSGVGPYLEPLINFALAAVPEAAHSSTPLYLQATAGMRLLPEDQQAALLGAVRDAFAASPFATRPEDALVVSGDVEGANEWTAVNYLRGALGGPDKSKINKAAPAGVLGMGGASTQIAFVPLEGTTLKAGAFPVAFEGLAEIELYVHSYLGLGTTEAQRSLQTYLASRHPDGQDRRRLGEVPAVADPCLLDDYSVTLPVGPGGTQVRLEGSSDSAACRAAIRSSLVNTDAPCPLTPCSFDGVYQVGFKLKTMDFTLNLTGFMLK